MHEVQSPSRRAFLGGRCGGSAPPAARRLARIAESCLTRHSVACRNCGDACPNGAIRFRPRRGAAALPELDRDACNGCADCLAPCPVGAIRLEEAP